MLHVCHCIRSGILCGFLLLSSSRSSTAVFISWHDPNPLSGYLLNPEIPEPPRSPSSAGQSKHQKTLQKQGIPPLPNASTGPDNLEVRRGHLCLTRLVPKPLRESSIRTTSTCKQRTYKIMLFLPWETKKSTTTRIFKFTVTEILLKFM